jgi:hypothetical protein
MSFNGRSDLIEAARTGPDGVGPLKRTLSGLSFWKSPKEANLKFSTGPLLVFCISSFKLG